MALTAVVQGPDEHNRCFRSPSADTRVSTGEQDPEQVSRGWWPPIIAEGNANSDWMAGENEGVIVFPSELTDPCILFTDPSEEPRTEGPSRNACWVA